MRVVFYLPVVTSWWFEHIVEPMLRRIAPVAEVHVIAPVRWQNTGIGPDLLERCVDLEGIGWHIVDGDDHPSLRTRAVDRDGLVEYIRQLAPDVVLCRAADFETAYGFPGIVRFMMEAPAAPFQVDTRTIVLTDQPFGNGAMPELDAEDRAWLEASIDPVWSDMQAHWQRAVPDREAIFRRLGIAGDRPMILLPLEYEHEENFFLQHHVERGSVRALLTRIAERVTPHCTLVLTDHPLNTQHVDRQALHATVGDLGPDVVLADPAVPGMPGTFTLARLADGMLLGDSKCFGIGAAFGVPMWRESHFASARWLKTETDLDRFVAAVRDGRAQAPSAADARAWFAFNFANDAFDPQDADLTGDDILDRARKRVNTDRWDAGLTRVDAVKQEHVR